MSSNSVIPALIKNLFLVQDDLDLVNFWDRLRQVSQPFVLAFVNAHAVNLACENEDFFHRLLRADLLLRDGIGLKLMLRHYGISPGINMNGTDLIPQILLKFPKRTVALYGTETSWLMLAQDKIKKQNSVIDILDGFQDDQAYLERALKSKPEIIVLAMGMPKQEKIATLLSQRLSHPCIIIAGGAILDFMAGRFPRAPRWIQKAGFEWLFRFAFEPRRLFRRYMIGNLVFFSHMVRQKLPAYEAKK